MSLVLVQSITGLFQSYAKKKSFFDTYFLKKIQNIVPNQWQEQLRLYRTSYLNLKTQIQWRGSFVQTYKIGLKRFVIKHLSLFVIYYNFISPR